MFTETSRPIWWLKMIAVTALAVSGCHTETADDHSDQFLLAQRMLKAALSESVDPTYEDERFDEVLEAFKKVPKDAPDRNLAEFWISRIENARADARELKRKSKQEAERLADILLETRAKKLPRFEAPDLAAVARHRKQRESTQDPEEPRPEDDHNRVIREETDHFGRTRDYWRRKKAALLKAKHDLEVAVDLEEKRVAVYCGGIGMTFRLSGTNASSPVDNRSISDLSHPPERIDVEDPTSKACTIHRKALERYRQQLASVEDRLARLKDEARRAGAPPGWLRGISDSSKVPRPEKSELPEPIPPVSP